MRYYAYNNTCYIAMSIRVGYTVLSTIPVVLSIEPLGLLEGSNYVVKPKAILKVLPIDIPAPPKVIFPHQSVEAFLELSIGSLK